MFIDTVTEQQATFTPDYSITVDHLLAELNAIYEYEEQNHDKDMKIITIDLKGLPIATIEQAMRHALTYPKLRNASMILNVMNLVASYNSLDESFFSHKSVYVSSIEDFLELKLMLKNEIIAFATELTKIFLSLIKSAAKVEYTFLDVVYTVPPVFDAILKSSSFLQLSAVMGKAEPISTEDLYIIEHSNVWLANIASLSFLSCKMMESMFGAHND